MKKAYFFAVNMLLIGVIIVIASVNADSKSPSQVKPRERFIVYETKADIDNDGKPERLVLDADKEGYGQDPGEYSRLLIYKTGVQNEKPVFDSIKAGVTDFCGEHIDQDHWISIADDDHNGTPEIYMQEYGFASSPCRLAIIEVVNGKYEVLFFDNLDGYGYQDFDNNGHLELYGITALGGQVRFNSPLWAAFIRKNNKYVPSYQYTQQLIKWEIDEAIQSFKIEPDLSTADYIIGMYVLGGYKEELKDFIKVNMDNLTKLEFFDEGFLNSDEMKNPDILIDQLKPLYVKKAAWLKSLQQENLQIAEADMASEEGFYYYQSHDDSMAVILYEHALSSYPTAETYYRYGNSLSNISRLKDAVNAYQNALQLNYDRPYLVYYNIACAYSKMKKSKEAFINLETAIDEGYKNFDHIEKDEDLVFLRSQPEWKNWWAKHKQPSR